MNINDTKNFTKDLDLENQRNIEVDNSLNNISMDELKQKMNEYLENRSNQLYQNNFDKEDAIKSESVPSIIEKSSANNAILRNDEFESRTPLGKIIIKNSVMENLSQNGFEKFKGLLNKNTKNKNLKNFFVKLNNIGKKSLEFVKKHAFEIISVVGKVIKKI